MRPRIAIIVLSHLYVVLWAAGEEHLLVVGEVEHDAVVIKDVAPLRVGPLLAAAHTLGLERRSIAKQPTHAVEAVDRLLHDVVAGKPRVVQPVADLVFHAAPIRFVAPVPQRTRVIT